MTDLNKDQFYYHGTRHPLNEGDTITPEAAQKYANYPESAGRVFASTNVAHAHRFAGMSDIHRAVWRGQEQGLGDKLSTYAPKVYKVAPLGNDVEPDEDAGMDFEGAEETSVQSSTGFRVLGRQW